MGESESGSKRGFLVAEDDLYEIHSFYLYLLESSFGEEIPVSGQIANDNDALRRFVMLMDLAVTPQMIRTGFRVQEHRNTAGSLLRFYAAKVHRRKEDREKVDVVATTLFRALFPTYGEQESSGAEEAVRDFETLLGNMYANIKVAEPSAEHKTLLGRFDALRAEAKAFRSYDELIDSGILERVRNVKHALGPSFLHPSVLSVVVAYNAFFRGVFDGLLARATTAMRAFASELDLEGALSTGDEGDAVVERLDLRNEVRQAGSAGRTMEDDRRQNRSVSEVVKSLKEVGADDATVPARSQNADPSQLVEGSGYSTPTTTRSVSESEYKELANVKDTIRSVVRASKTQAGQVITLPEGTFQLTNAEAEAFFKDRGKEKSFRADCLTVLEDMVAIDARLRSQLAMFESTKHTPYNWKSHADALAHLLAEGKTNVERALELAGLARERGMRDEAEALTERVEKIRPRGRAAVDALKLVGEGSATNSN